VSLTDTGKLQWAEQRDGEPLIHSTEPGTTWLKRLGVALMALLPIDWLL
jgi:putative cardiolipin synthase